MTATTNVSNRVPHLFAITERKELESIGVGAGDVYPNELHPLVWQDSRKLDVDMHEIESYTSKDRRQGWYNALEDMVLEAAR